MKRKVIFTLIISLVLTAVPLSGQESSSELQLSLKQAQDYALAHNKSVISAKMDLEASRVALWETISTALPQVTATAS